MPTPSPLQAGRPWPLGAYWDGQGVNFAVASLHAQAIEVCLFDALGEQELQRMTLPGRSGDIWHGYLAGAGPGLVYGLRAHGLWDPAHAHRFNPHKVLLDPYAREVVGEFVWNDLHFGHQRSQPDRMDLRDNAAQALKARVVHDQFDWQGDAPPYVAHEDTVLYELHVRGFSRANPELPVGLRGTFEGLAHPSSIAHFQRLGVTSLSLLPVHFSLDEERLVQQGLRNYWGYNTLAFFALQPRLAAQRHQASVRDEFRTMVRTLHQHGLEVLLDVVFNHTAESDETGPHLSFRGLDNAGYYRLRADNHALYENHSGCGNTLDIRQPRVLQLVLDSLRYWVGEMHVDGFRFDLAPVLGRGDHGFERSGAFFTAIAQDPLLSRVKMIAEPWDIGPGGYQVGGFPQGWMEWNDRFRDVMRQCWVRWADHACHRGDFAMRLCGSSDLYQRHHRRQRPPAESVNYIVSHDGFTLLDLVSYEQRHNEANGENNHDGHGNNLSNHCGVEGPTSDPTVLALRGRLQRALLASTVLAQGTPMLCAGSELGHSQQGNNNPYCQDNPTTWIDWSRVDEDLLAFTSTVIALRQHMLPLRNQWYTGEPDAQGVRDLDWLQADGCSMPTAAWSDYQDQALGCWIGHPGRVAGPVLLWLNWGGTDVACTLPPGSWKMALDTAHPRGEPAAAPELSASVRVRAHSLVLLVHASASAAPLPVLDGS